MKNDDTMEGTDMISSRVVQIIDGCVIDTMQEDELNCLTVCQVLQVHIAIYRISGIHIDT